MKKTMMILGLITFLVSCGKNNSSESKHGKKIDPALGSTELTTEENKLRESLLKQGVIEQKKLIKKILTLNALDQTTLKKLDLFINVQCIQSSGLCYITHKD